MPKITVQPRSNLFQIAKGTGYTPEQLAAYNMIEDPNQIRVGQDIFIPYSRQEFESFAGPMTQPVQATTPVSQPVAQQPQAVPTSQAQIVNTPSFPWSSTAPSNLPSQAQNLYTGQNAYDLIEQTFPNETLNELHKHIVELEGYSPNWYQLPGDKVTVGVGQVDAYTSMTPREAMDAKIEELKSFMPEFDNASEELQKGLLSAYYRGDMGPSAAPQNWPQLYSDYIADPTQANKNAAIDETWDSDEYRNRQARIEWRIANGYVRPDGTVDQSVTPLDPSDPDYETSLIDVGVMNRVKGWMDTLYGTTTPPASAQTQINAIENSL
jgi:LysM repeat protein